MSSDLKSGLRLSADAFTASHIGRPVWNLQIPADHAAAQVDAELGGLLDALESPSTCIAKVAVDRTDLTALLGRHGFTLVDTNVQYAKPRDPDVVMDPRVRLAQESDRAGVGDVAGTSFRFTRFHLDPMIPVAAANALKREWAENYFTGARGDHMLVALHDTRIAGFNQILDRGDTRIIDLIAVAAIAQRRGLGRALCLAAEAIPGPATRMLVGTQIANIPSITLYETLGYRLVGASYVFHRHAGIRTP